jgi:hypothetical protein
LMSTTSLSCAGDAFKDAAKFLSIMNSAMTVSG